MNRIYVVSPKGSLGGQEAIITLNKEQIVVDDQPYSYMVVLRLINPTSSFDIMQKAELTRTPKVFKGGQRLPKKSLQAT